MPKLNIYEVDRFMMEIDLENEFAEEFMYEIPEEILAEYIEIEARRKELNKKLKEIRGYR